MLLLSLLATLWLAVNVKVLGRQNPWWSTTKARRTRSRPQACGSKLPIPNLPFWVVPLRSHPLWIPCLEARSASWGKLRLHDQPAAFPESRSEVGGREHFALLIVTNTSAATTVLPAFPSR